MTIIEHEKFDKVLICHIIYEYKNVKVSKKFIFYYIKIFYMGGIFLVFYVYKQKYNIYSIKMYLTFLMA